MPRAATPPPQPAAEPPAEPTPVRHAVLLARAGGLAILAAVLIPLVSEGIDRWNVFAVLSPLEAVGAGVAAFVVSRGLRAGTTDVTLAAGWLLGLGGLLTVAALGLLRFTLNRLDGLATLLAVVALLAALAILAAGVGCLRVARPPAAQPIFNPGPLVLGLAGAALAAAAMFVNYDGFSSLWLELQEGESAEFFFEPALVVIVALFGVGLLGARPRLAGGLLLAVGLAATLHYAGLLIAAAKAIGEEGDVRSAAYIGILGGLLILAAGALASRSR